MKISDPNGRVVSGLGRTIGPASGARSASPAAPSLQGDQIQLSGLMARLSGNGSSEHVGRLSQLVSSGQYQVDSNAVSAAMIQDRLGFSAAY
ncbi:MAG: hypothetical protein LAP38_10205 [Acidobacteriia bacterium]|nr:hypothetical protein [Terriglobia bacterium]